MEKERKGKKKQKKPEFAKEKKITWAEFKAMNEVRTEK